MGLKPCLERGCPTLSTETRCREHTRQHQRQRDYNRRDDPIRQFRRSQAWIKLAKRIMAAGPRCCSLCGTGQALTVDHIIPLTRCLGSGLETDPGNLRILCVTCQNKTAARWRASFSGGPD